MTILRNLAAFLACILAASSASYANVPARTCELDMMCIVFSEGFEQCQKMQEIALEIGKGDTITFDGDELPAVARERAGDDPGWTIKTDPTSFGLVYEINTYGSIAVLSVINEGEIRGSYQGMCVSE